MPIFDLPLFPLNTVLFPGMPLNLHIFEERYRRMMHDCLEKDQVFGVVLIRRGQEAMGPLAEPHEVGCSARLQNVDRLADGSMNITVIGQQRFRILSLRRERPYLVGTVDPFPLTEKDTSSLSKSSRSLRPWVRRYMEILSQVADIDLKPSQLPADPFVFAYLSAVLLQVPAAQKQSLLSAERANEMLADMHALYRREVALLRALIAHEPQRDGDQFSVN